MEFTTETITPKKAEAYLATSEGNRPQSKITVQSYARAMANGGWQVNGQCIIFDEDGHLLDGHHRLNAVIRADKAVVFGVLRGVDKRAFTTIDCGLKRTAGQILAMSGVKNANNIAAVVTQTAVLCKTGRLGECSGTYSLGAFSNSEKFKMYQLDAEGFTEAERFSTEAWRKGKIIKPSWVGAIYYYLVNFGHYDRAYVEKFFRTACSLDSSDVAVASLLRKNILKLTLSGKRPTAELLWAWIAKAWNYYVDGKSPKKLCYKPGSETLPKLKLRKSEVQVAEDEENTLTTTQIAKELGYTSARALNEKLRQTGIIFYQSGLWMLNSPYSSWKMSSLRTVTIPLKDGTTIRKSNTVWNERGRTFIHALKKSNFNVNQAIDYIKGGNV